MAAKQKFYVDGNEIKRFEQSVSVFGMSLWFEDTVTDEQWDVLCRMIDRAYVRGNIAGKHTVRKNIQEALGI